MTATAQALPLIDAVYLMAFFGLIYVVATIVEARRKAKQLRSYLDGLKRWSSVLPPPGFKLVEKRDERVEGDG